MSEFHSYQRELLDAIMSGVKPMSLWTHGRRNGKSYLYRMFREYCKQNGIKVVELSSETHSDTATWHDESHLFDMYRSDIYKNLSIYWHSFNATYDDD